MQKITCPLCASTKSDLFAYRHDDRYGYPGEYPLQKCRECGHLFLGHHFSAAALKRMYSEYYPRTEFNLKKFRPYEEATGFFAWLQGKNCHAFRHVPRNVRVLDIGCGFGETMGYFTNRNCDAYGIDVDTNLERVRKKFKYNLKVGLFSPKFYKKSFFDYVIMDQVIEHVTDPLATLQGVKTVLKPGGILIMSTPNFAGFGAKFFGERSILWHTPYHLQYWQKEVMQAAAKKAGLIFVRHQTITQSEWLFYQICHAVLYPKKGDKSPFFDPRQKKTVWDIIIIGSIFLFHQTRLTSLFSRMTDAWGQGDNSLYFLQKPR